jgi:hypothetical protein
MNMFRTIAGAALISALFASVPATAEPLIVAEKIAAPAMQSRDGRDRRVRITNTTGWTMLRFYASDSRVTSWEEDMLGRGTLASGRSITMNIDDGSGACLYDFRAEFTNGQVLTRFNINVCEISTYNYRR